MARSDMSGEIQETRSPSAAPAEMQDAVEVLQSDHRQVKDLFDTYLESGDTAIIQQICDMLEVHDRAERTYFYPDVSAEAGDEARKLIDDGKLEHQAIVEIVGKLRAMSGDEPEFSETAAWLQEQVLHHVEEEENELFPIVREAMGGERLRSIGVQIVDLKKRAAEAH